MNPNSVKETVINLKRQGKKGLSFFLTAGYPTLPAFEKTVRFIDSENLADFIEIGLPFSDPIADGPTIQSSSQRVLENEVSIKQILDSLETLVNEVKIPMVIMTYLNPLFSGNLEKNLKKIRKIGIDTLIVPDLPYNCDSEIEKTFKNCSLSQVLLISPSTDIERAKKIVKKSDPFVYYVSSLGVTGSRKTIDGKILKDMKRLWLSSEKPVYCGFGISNALQAQKISRLCDGLIIGSAFIQKIGTRQNINFKEIKKFAISIKLKIN